ncbi:DUF4148 domain-containing protein [Paraburkholderia sp. DHOC27]|uniref:DUF4148 domain-containing protein n=1 Tax=Paraburkholderia sp. DHOC27 TaxID=2303330 RepID=UPI000E3C1A78|nr:DUF4148 domain-containing protein [Paraburkholderia sp. DHOC27]RFU48405.1 hypothetical protein D0B32_00715 [Paraburkholderia sp. DHOC27]
MKRFRLTAIALGFTVAAFVAGTAVPAIAQTDTGATDAGGAMAASGATTKAERKAARKQARAKKNAELKKLEENGYQPGRADPNYPQDLQNAQKKAGIGQGASQ